MVPASAKDAYRILGISEGVSPDEIKNAYRTTALKWHPDRHHSRYDKELATRYFAEATNAYRTLVREGHLKYRELPVVNIPESHPVQRPPQMTKKSSSQSSISLDSFIHLVASSTETLTTPSSSNRESHPSSRKQGIRVPSETVASQYRNLAPPVNNFHHEYQRGVKGPAMYKPAPATQLHDQQKKPKVPKSSPAKPKGGTHQSIPPQNPVPSPTHHHDFRQSYDPPREYINRRNDLPPYSLPLRSIGLGHSGEWVYSISLTLEELFTGKHCHFGITRYYTSGRSKNVVIEIDIPVGCRPGTRILCRNVGHEWKPKCFQDIAFIVEESPHDRFIRLFDDLIMDVRVPWVDSLKRQGGKVPFVGIDGRNLVIQIDYPRDKNMKGRCIIKGAGMPIRQGGQMIGRGNMVVQWEILPQKTKILHFVKQFWSFGFKN